MENIEFCRMILEESCDLIVGNLWKNLVQTCIQNLFGRTLKTCTPCLFAAIRLKSVLEDVRKTCWHACLEVFLKHNLGKTNASVFGRSLQVSFSSWSWNFLEKHRLNFNWKRN